MPRNIINKYISNENFSLQIEMILRLYILLKYMYSFWKEKQHTILSITCIPRILLSCTSTLINQVNKMLWICSIQFVYNCISSFQSLQVLKSSDLKPYIVFVYPPNMEKLRQMQKNFYPDTTITVRNLSVLSLSFFLSLCVCVCVCAYLFLILTLIYNWLYMSLQAIHT